MAISIAGCDSTNLGAGDPSKPQRIDSVLVENDSLRLIADYAHGMINDVTRELVRIGTTIRRADSSLARFAPRMQRNGGEVDDTLRDAIKGNLEEVEIALRRFERSSSRANGSLDSIKLANAKAAGTVDSLRTLVRALRTVVQASQQEYVTLSRRYDSLTAAHVALQERHDSLVDRVEVAEREVRDQARKLANAAARQQIAYLAIGSRDALVERGLVRRVGRALIPTGSAETWRYMTVRIDTLQFVRFPRRDKKYQIVSGQDLSGAGTSMKPGEDLKGGFYIRDSERFWAPSRFLIIWER